MCFCVSCITCAVTWSTPMPTSQHYPLTHFSTHTHISHTFQQYIPIQHPKIKTHTLHPLTCFIPHFQVLSRGVDHWQNLQHAQRHTSHLPHLRHHKQQQDGPPKDGEVELQRLSATAAAIRLSSVTAPSRVRQRMGLPGSLPADPL